MFGIPEWAIGVGFIILAGSLARGFSRGIYGGPSPRNRLDGRKGSKHDLAEAVAEMQGKLDALGDIQARLAEVEDAQRRLAEVEERLDFAERMLAQQRGAERLSSPKQ